MLRADFAYAYSTLFLKGRDTIRLESFWARVVKDKPPFESWRAWRAGQRSYVRAISHPCFFSRPRAAKRTRWSIGYRGRGRGGIYYQSLPWSAVWEPSLNPLVGMWLCGHMSQEYVHHTPPA